MLNRLSLCAFLQRSPDRVGLIRLRRDVIDLPRTITHNPEIHNTLFAIPDYSNDGGSYSVMADPGPQFRHDEKPKIEAEMRAQCAPKAIMRVNFSRKSIAFHS
jgi:hypothetical protein